MRDIINFLTHEEDKEDVKYLKIVYDDINHLIELVESNRDTINSTKREVIHCKYITSNERCHENTDNIFCHTGRL